MRTWSVSVLFLIFLGLSVSCKDDKQVHETNVGIADTINTSVNKKEDAELKKLTIDFFTWYKTNRERIDNIEFLKGGDFTEKDSTAFYIDRQGMERYLMEFKKSGFLSRRYLDAYREHLNNVAVNLEKEKIYDGVVEGLDFDYITQSQDDDEILNNIKFLKQLDIKSKTKRAATVYYEVMPKVLFLKVDFIYESKWVIDDYRFDYKLL